MSKPKIILKGDKALIKKLKRLGDRRQIRRVLKKATNASAQIVLKSVRKLYPTDTKFSRRSVTKKIIKTKGGFTAIIGVDRDAAAIEGEKVHIPSQIDHLIELGWQTPEGKTVPAVAPLRRGYEASKEQSERRFAEKAAEEIEKEAMKR